SRSTERAALSDLRDRNRAALCRCRTACALRETSARPPPALSRPVAQASVLWDQSPSRKWFGRGAGFKPGPTDDDFTATHRAGNATCALCRGPWCRSGLHMLLCRSHQRRKSLGIAHGHICQNLAVDIDAADL